MEAGGEKSASLLITMSLTARLIERRYEVIAVTPASG